MRNSYEGIYFDAYANPMFASLRENQHVLREGYAAMSIAAIARHLRIGERMIVKGGCRLGRHDEILSAPVRLVVTRLVSGELLAVACSGSARHALARRIPDVRATSALHPKASKIDGVIGRRVCG